MNKLAISYLSEPGKNAKRVADFARRDDIARALRIAPHAKGELDLMHPELWKVWRMTSDEAFEAVVPMLDAREIQKLLTARDENGWSVGCYMVDSIKKLSVLVALGLPSSGVSAYGSPELGIELGTWCAMRGKVNGLLHLANIGAESPMVFSAAVGAMLDRRNKPRSALHLLAGCLQLKPVPQEDMKKALEWLVKNAPLKLRSGRDGFDALALAIDNGRPEIVPTLLEMGADPNRKDSKCRNAFDLLERRVKALGVQGDYAEAAALKVLRGVLLAHAERKELGAILDEPQAGVRRIRSL